MLACPVFINIDFSFRIIDDPSLKHTSSNNESLATLDGRVLKEIFLISAKVDDNRDSRHAVIDSEDTSTVLRCML
jgi:hypothetical protein